VNPPYPAGSHRHPPFIPLGIGYLAAVLEKNGYDVNVIDCQALPLTLAEVENELRKRKPDVVGLTSTTLTYKSALEIIKVAKKVLPNSLTVIGGSHVTFWDENALKECPQLDVVVRKEGEETLVELMQKLEKGESFSDVLGITFRNGEEFVRTADRPYIEDLDSLPFPAVHLFPIEQFNKYGNIIFPVMTSRGCVFWCEFCTAVRMFGRRYRMRSPKSVVDELEFLYKKYGEKQYTFYDDAFTVDQERTKEICNEILRRGLKIKWDCETRVDMVSKELLQKMNQAGCIAVWYGVEAGSDKVRDAMGKGISLQQTFDAFKWTHVTCTDMSGNFAFPFIPEVEGTYMIIATFEGTESYYRSVATTYLTIDPAPEAFPYVPTAEEIASDAAQRTIAMMPQFPYVPTAEEIASDAAQRTIAMMPQFPAATECPAIPAYLTIDLVIIAAVVVAIVIGLYGLIKKQK